MERTRVATRWIFLNEVIEKTVDRRGQVAVVSLYSTLEMHG